MTETSNTSPQASSRHAFLVASGIFLSRIFGFLRERAIAHYFGNSNLADAFKAAYRIPNFLQNLLGEGVLSASFIPVYAQLMAQNKVKEANELAASIFWLLFGVVFSLSLLGVIFAPHLIPLIAPGFSGETLSITIRLVQILFPGTAILVLSAWCLGILNTHSKFFLSYSAPVIWNFTQIVVLLWAAQRFIGVDLIESLAWSLFLGSFLQFLVQLPQVFKHVPSLWPSFKIGANARTVIKNFFPVLFSRGVVQVSAYVDIWLASLLPTGAVSSMSFAQMLYLLPVSLFGMSISAAELPAMSKVQGTSEEVNALLRNRILSGTQRVAFFVIPSVVVFLILGDVLIGGVFQTGAFHHDNTLDVWRALAGSAIGLLAATMGRIYSSAFYALKDTKTPMRFALIRVTLTVVLGYLMGIRLPVYLQVPPMWGLSGLTASAGIAGWIEYLLLRNALGKKIGLIQFKKSFIVKLWSLALVSGAISYLVYHYALIPAFGTHVFISGVTDLFIYSVLYLILAMIFKIEQVQMITRKLKMFQK